jgi:hypothetical protein
MKPVAKIICVGIALGWLQGAAAREVTVSNDPVVLELATALPAPAQAGTAAPVTRVQVKAHYEKVDRANIEKRMADRAARTKKRKADAEKDVAERAAKAQLNPTAQPGQ